MFHLLILDQLPSMSHTCTQFLELLCEQLPLLPEPCVAIATEIVGDRDATLLKSVYDVVSENCIPNHKYLFAQHQDALFICPLCISDLYSVTAYCIALKSDL